MPVHSYRYRGNEWCRLLPGLDFFRLVAPPLLLGVVGPFLVRGARFPNHLPLEKTGRIQSFGL
jgi:hypothetical protein